MGWETSDLDDETRDPYDLWYLDEGPDFTGVNAPRTDQWYPHLLSFDFAPDANMFAIGGAVASIRDELEVTFTTHDFWHFIHHALTDGEDQAELIVFVRSGSGIHGALDFLSGIESIERVVSLQRGAPVNKVGNADPELGWFTEENFRRFNPREKGGPVPRLGVVIDHAIGFANARFCRNGENGRESRFEKVWAQGAQPQSDVVGMELDNSALSAEIQTIDGSTTRAESSFYTSLGLVNLTDPAFRRGDIGALASSSHGTQVADVAFGADPYSDAAALPLLGVQLPAGTVARTNGFLHDLYIKSALNWAVYQGLKMNGFEMLPEIFVNHSFGAFSGRHDGAALLEADFDRRLQSGEITMITAAAGNSFQSATHARLTRAQLADTSFDSDLTLVVQPDDRSSTFVQIWADVPSQLEGEFPVSVTVTPPGKGPSRTGRMAVGTTQSLSHDRELLARLYCQARSGAGGAERRVITLAIAPNTDANGQPTPVPAGDWKLSFGDPADDLAESGIAIWVERGDTPQGFAPAGRQAYLSHPAYQRYSSTGRLPKTDAPDCPIRRFGTLSSVGTAHLPIVVSAFRGSDGEMSDFASASSEIMPRDAVQNLPAQPVIATIAETSATRPDMLASGTASGSVRMARGTSFAAPLALRLAMERGLGKQEMAGRAAQDEATKAYPQASRYRYGHGRLAGGYTATLPRRRAGG